MRFVYVRVCIWWGHTYVRVFVRVLDSNQFMGAGQDTGDMT